MTNVPGANVWPFESKPFATRYVGTLAFCNSATTLNAPYDSGPIRYAPLARGGAGVGTGATVFNNSRDASKGFSIASTLTPSSIHNVCPVTSYGGSGGPPGKIRRSG